ncbi:MAG: hypothetical protein IT548_12035 [Alphaproteobacteria bacterium]|nr:hypothetical protein [Alphaproteobacteria bacterium]
MTPIRSAAAAFAFGLATGLAFAPASAGCDINLRIENTGRGELQISLRDSASKIKGGFWADFKGRIRGIDGGTEYIYVAAGDAFAGVLETDFGCNTKRRFRISNACGERDGTGNFRAEDDRDRYAPSDDGWTEDRNVTIAVDRCRADY